MTTSFSVVIADPPWAFADRLEGSVRRGAASQYPVMSTAAIAGLHDVLTPCLDPERGVLGLWCPSAMLDDGLLVLRAWGFCLKGTYVWGKVRKGPAGRQDTPALGFGMGHLFRQAHEVALIGAYGAYLDGVASRSERSIVLAEEPPEDIAFAPVTGHSVKPTALHAAFERVYPAAGKLELFARSCRQGWSGVGHGVCGGEDIRETLKRYSVTCTVLNPVPRENGQNGLIRPINRQ